MRAIGCETPHGPATVRADTGTRLHRAGCARLRLRTARAPWRRGNSSGHGALNQSPDVTNNIDDRRLFVRAIPFAGRLADFVSFYSVNVFQDRHRVGSVPAARASLSPIAASLDDSGPSGRYTASRGSSHRLGAAPLVPGPTLSLAARRRALCLGVVWCRSCGPSRTVNTPVTAPPMPHPARPLPSAPLVTMP